MEACRLRTVVSLTIQYNGRLFGTLNTSSNLLSCVPLTLVGFARGAHTTDLNKNMQYISNDKVKLRLDPSTMKSDSEFEPTFAAPIELKKRKGKVTANNKRTRRDDELQSEEFTEGSHPPYKRTSTPNRFNQKLDKPLCIMMTYMMAKPKHVLKYAELYLTQEIDVIAVSCTPWQLMWPVKGSQVVADQLLRLLEVNKCGSEHPLMVHGFSVGLYLWSELLLHATKDKQRYQPVLDRVRAQIWDSGADVHEIPVGFPTAVFPKNKFLQETFRAYIKTHMYVFYNVATKHYLGGTGVFHKNPCKAPSLFLVSKTDPIGAEKRSREKAASWESLGIKCTIKCWDRSPHVQHYLHHSEEYKDTLYTHLNKCGVLKCKS